ncbi:hypothetical protein SUSAZ_09090 [Sulfolobus acidocaldarius SUSAZ]|nr:hypothetical protein SUSAZ_09090 [Sulfolobus acidocaldarius SUSAZ]
MINNRYYALISMTHNDCWSRLTSSFDYSDVLIDSQTNLGVLRAKRIIISRHPEPKKVINETLRKDHTIIDFSVDVLSRNRKYKIIFVDMIQKENHAIVSRFKRLENEERNLILSFSRINNGIEEYELVISNRDNEEILSYLRGLDVTVNNFETKPLSYRDILRIVNRGIGDVIFTERQKIALTKAKEMGYFDIPRGAELDDVAEELGVSKMRASLIIRSIVKKIVDIL